MEATVTPIQEQDYVEIPFGEGTLRVTGDEGVLQDLYQEYHAVEALPKRAIQGVANFIGAIANNVALETKMFAFDRLHGTNYRDIRHELIEQERRRKFEQSIGLVAVKKR